MFSGHVQANSPLSSLQSSEWLRSSNHYGFVGCMVLLASGISRQLWVIQRGLSASPMHHKLSAKCRAARVSGVLFMLWYTRPYIPVYYKAAPWRCNITYIHILQVLYLLMTSFSQMFIGQSAPLLIPCSLFSSLCSFVKLVCHHAARAMSSVVKQVSSNLHTSCPFCRKCLAFPK